MRFPDSGPKLKRLRASYEHAVQKKIGQENEFPEVISCHSRT